MRRRWCVLLMGLLMGCGRPLQISTTPGPLGLPSPLPIETASTLSTAGSVPGTIPPEQLTPDLSSTQPLPVSTPATATLMPTAALTPTAALVTPASPPTPTLAVLVVPRTAVPRSNEQLWRDQQLDRQILEPRRIYVTNNLVTLWWYDPLTGQSLAIGTLVGEFPVQALFTLRNEKRAALEVPYTINVDFGLTSISDAVRERMRQAGYTQSVEAYVFQTDDVRPK